MASLGLHLGGYVQRPQLPASPSCFTLRPIQAVIARLDRAIQYAAAYRFRPWRLWNTGSPACAGDDN